MKDNGISFDEFIGAVGLLIAMAAVVILIAVGIEWLFRIWGWLGASGGLFVVGIALMGAAELLYRKRYKKVP